MALIPNSRLIYAAVTMKIAVTGGPIASVTYATCMKDWLS